MWRRAYFILTLIRIYFALSPSYLHPDEHFQGPEVIAGRIFNHAIHQTWEFSSSAPIRSVFPLWPIYGLPMLLLKSIWSGWSTEQVPAIFIFNTLRVVLFCLSFVLEDWALHELVPIRSQRRTAILLVASSYVTWTWQVHTFSNSIETVLVLWSLVLIRRIADRAKASRSGYLLAASVLSFLLVFGTFNRITFPAFVVIPLLQLIPALISRPPIILTMLAVSSFVACFAVMTDTVFYNPYETSLRSHLRHPVITPLNNLLYNTDSANLALHGTHPHYQHFLVNLPQLLGPAFLLLVMAFRSPSIQHISAIFGTFVLSVFSHQEARFLLPAVPLILSSAELPKRYTRSWIYSWVIFNIFLGLLMGVYHQGGVVPAQIHLSNLPQPTNQTIAFWWKTYSPPGWLLGPHGDKIETVDMMGIPVDSLSIALCSKHGPASKTSTLLVAPASAIRLDEFLPGHPEAVFELEEVWRYRHHLNLDDMDFGDDGILPTLKRVVGRRGLVIWRVNCR